MALTPTPVHRVEVLDLDSLVESPTIEERYALYGLEGRREDADDSGDGGVATADGDDMSWIGSEVVVLVAESAPTRRAGERWFVCPVTGESLPVSEGVRFRGRLYSAEGAETVRDRERDSKSGASVPPHWSDNGDVKKV